VGVAFVRIVDGRRAELLRPRLQAADADGEGAGGVLRRWRERALLAVAGDQTRNQKPETRKEHDPAAQHFWFLVSGFWFRHVAPRTDPRSFRCRRAAARWPCRAPRAARYLRGAHPWRYRRRRGGTPG